MKLAHKLIDTLKRATWPLLGFSTFFLAFGLFLLVVFFTTLTEWRSEKGAYEAWLRTDQPAACKRIQTVCDVEPPKPTARRGISLEDSLEDQVRRSFPGNDYDIFRCTQKAEKTARIKCRLGEPGDFWSSLIAKLSGDFVRDTKDTTILWVGLFVFLLAARAVAREKHKGWQRLTLVIAALLTPAVGFYIASETEEVIIPSTYGALIAGLVVPIFARRVYLWVQSGFAGTANRHVQPVSEVRSELDQKAIRLTPRLVLSVLGITVLIAGGLAMIALNPVQSASVLISPLIQMTAVVVVYILGKWIYTWWTTRGH